MFTKCLTRVPLVSRRTWKGGGGVLRGEVPCFTRRGARRRKLACFSKVRDGEGARARAGTFRWSCRILSMTNPRTLRSGEKKRTRKRCAAAGSNEKQQEKQKEGWKAWVTFIWSFLSLPCENRGLSSQNAAFTPTHSHKLVLVFMFVFHWKKEKVLLRFFFFQWETNIFTFYRCHSSYNMHNSELIGSLMKETDVPNKVARWPPVLLQKTSRTF